MHYAPAIGQGNLARIAEGEFVDSCLVEKCVGKSDFFCGACVSDVVYSGPHTED